MNVYHRNEVLFMKNYKIHLLDIEEDDKVPLTDKSKRKGWRISKCGYQRKYTSTNIEDVDCKICLREYENLLK
jgi:hypothetical protein